MNSYQSSRTVREQNTTKTFEPKCWGVSAEERMGKAVNSTDPEPWSYGQLQRGQP